MKRGLRLLIVGDLEGLPQCPKNHPDEEGIET